jgi:hypothetical protein
MLTIPKKVEYRKLRLLKIDLIKRHSPIIFYDSQSIMVKKKKKSLSRVWNFAGLSKSAKLQTDFESAEQNLRPNAKELGLKHTNGV